MLFFFACTEDPIEEKEVEVETADPFLGVTLATGSGSLKSTCEIALTVRDETGAEIYSGAIPGQGREWLGTRIDPSTLYTATTSWTDCTNTEYGTGSMDTASAVSAEPGTLLVFHFDGIDAAFDSLVQDADFVGGAVDVELAAGADGAALAAAAGVSGEATETADVWHFSWTDATPVGEVLMLASYDDSYVEGTPVWLGDLPLWW